jgi:uncharacterized protein YceH (UPF0502 family)
MKTQDVSSEIETVLNTLSQEGKTPTVALVKARLSTPVPMPAIITAIKSWKAASRIPKIEVAAEQALPAEQRIEQLEQQIAALTARIEKLETGQ